MEQGIIIENLRSDTGKRFLSITQYLVAIAGTHTFSSIVVTGGIVIPVLSLAISLIIGALQPDYNPIKQTISQLVHYPHGWFQTTDFLVLGVWVILFAIKIYGYFTHRLITKITVLSLILVGVGFFLITACPTNFPGSDRTLQSIIHEKVAQSICIVFPVSWYLLIKEFKSNRFWKKFAAYTTATVIIGAVLFGVGAIITATDAPLFGIIERLILLNAIIWLEIISAGMLIQQYRENQSSSISRQIIDLFTRLPGKILVN